MKIFNNKVIKYLFINLILLSVFYAGIIRPSFTADTIYHMANADADVFVRLEQGRFVIALFDAIFWFGLGFRTTDCLAIFTVLTLVEFAISMLFNELTFEKIFDKSFIEDITLKNIICMLAMNFMFTNVFFVEMLMFKEFSFYFGMAYLMASAAIYMYVNKKYAAAMIFAIFSVFTYQYTAIYLCMILAFIICMSEEFVLSIKLVIKEFATMAVCMLIGFLDVLVTKILQYFGYVDRFGKEISFASIFGNFTYYVMDLKEMNKSLGGLFPPLWIPLFITVMFLGIAIYILVVLKESKKIITLVILLIGEILLLYAMPAIQSEYFLPPRMSFLIFFIQGMLVLVTIHFISKKEADYRLICIFEKICFIAISGYLFLNAMVSNFEITNLYVSNSLDRVYIDSFLDYIEDYENESGCEINNISICNDDYAPPYYPQVKYYYHQINERSLGIVTHSLLWKIGGRYFDTVPMDSVIYDEYFAGKDFESFNLEKQVVIVDDTAYWCIF